MSQHSIDKLKDFLSRLCASTDDGSFVWQMATATSRWSSVEDLLAETDRQELWRIAFNSELGGFSACNLKAHYVLDEDFVNDGSAFILFSLVGSVWTYVVAVKDQNRFTTVDTWLQGE
ncbi:MAG: hypothetical protein H7839_06780 [Magnetococcus sp. YQC-5]